MDGMPEKSVIVKDLQRDLARKYQLHGPKIKHIWHSLDRSQRVKAIRDGAADGLVLKTPTDRSLGNVYKIMPEWNLRDIADPESDFLLDLLEHRTTHSLCEQYCEGVNGGPGDHAVISESMRTKGLALADPLRNCFVVFYDEGKYGRAYKTQDRETYRQTMAALSKGVDAGLIVPQSMGELMLQRQLYLLQRGLRIENDEPQKKKPEEVANAALSRLSIESKPEKLSLEELLSRAFDQKNSLEDYVRLCRSKPGVLAHVVNSWFFSRPELVPDEKGRMLPLLLDKYISIAIFEVMHNAVSGAAIWGYIYSLLDVLREKPNDRVYRAFILQELTTVCHFEYDRVQKLFTRFVQMGSGSKYFKRISGASDNGAPRVKMSIKPETLMTDITHAADLITKLDERFQSHPLEREDMTEVECDAFGDIAVTTSFIQSLSASLALPPINHRKGRTYITKLKSVGTEIDSLKDQIDLSNFAVPIDNLSEPGMAEGVLSTLDQFIIDKTGTEIGFIYQDLNEECLSAVKGRYEKELHKIALSKEAEIALSASESETDNPVVRIERRREKHKTRPAHSSIYSIAPTGGPRQNPIPQRKHRKSSK